MGLDISAYSNLRYVGPQPEDWEGDDDRVLVYECDGDRVDDCPYGLYAPIDDVHVWWKAEHGSHAIPESEIERIAHHIAGVQDGSTKPGTPGDLAVLDEARPVTDSHGFRAGSYSGYNWWREQLSRFALGAEPAAVWERDGGFDGQPFIELIDFPDNEGAIGPATSAKLLADFVEHEARVVGIAKEKLADADEREYFVETYDNFKLAFQLAAQSGFVIFH